MPACVYARDSRDDGNESFGIDSQTRYCLTYAEKHGLIVPPDYVLEEEWTGKDWSRPKFDILKQLIEFHHIDSVIVYKVNRISRIDYHALMFLRDFCFRHKVVLHIVEWGRSVKDDSNDVILFGLQAQFGHIERDDIVRRTQRGRVEKATQGIFLGQGTTVYGYEKTGSKKNTALVIIPEESAVVKLIFGLFVTKGIQIADIARYLNAQHIPSPANAKQRFWQSAEWNHNSVLRIIRDPRYIGEFYAFRYTKDEQTGRTVLREREEWIKQAFPELAIIDSETYYAAQTIIDSRKNRYTFATKYEYLMNKRMWCICGHKIGVQTMEKNERLFQYYRCVHKRKNSKDACRLTYINSTKLDIAIWDAIEYFIRNPAIVLEELRDVQQKQREEHRDATITVETLDTIRKDYHRRVDKLYSDYDRGLIPESVYLTRKIPLDEGLQTAEKMYTEQQAILDQKVLSDGDIKHIVHVCQDYATLLDTIGVLDFEDKRKAIETFDITGTLVIQNHTLVLVLSMYRKAFKELVTNVQISCSLKVEYEQGITDCAAVTLRIVVGKLKGV